MISFIIRIFEKRLKNLSEERREVLEFSLYVLLFEIPKIILIFAIAGFLNIFNDVLISFVMLSLYRTNSGGFHLKTNLGCFIWSSIILLLPAYLVNNFNVLIQTEYILVIYAILFIFNIYCITKYAPADNENAPIISNEIRKKKKIYSYIAVIINFVVSIIFIEYNVSKIITILIFIQSLSITPFMYKISKCNYGKEVR